MIAYHSGKEFSYEALSKGSGVRKDLLKKYIEYLEAAFLIKVIHRTDDNAKSYQREFVENLYGANNMNCTMVTTKTESGLKELQYGKVQFIPVACYAYTVGRNTLNSVKDSSGL